jgi:predicted N-formylglutamate amidohydrolase
VPSSPLLHPDEPAAVLLERPHGASPFFFVCDHASSRIPRRLEHLGLEESERLRHIAWDIGALAVAQRLSERFDACLVAQGYSRLVIDCNRPLGTPQSIALTSERTRIVGNEGISAAEAQRRAEEIFTPYHATIVAELEARLARRQPTVLVSVHSFTPTYLDVARSWHTGVLYKRDTRLAHLLLAELRARHELVVGDNEPYAVSDETDYAIPIHGEQRGIPHVGIEIRQDLITEADGQARWADILGAALEKVGPGLLASMATENAGNERGGA